MGARRRQLAAIVLALALLGAGCTYSDREAGLFGRTPTAVDRPSEGPPDPPDSAGPIPLLGEAIWTSADTPPIPVRVAVHGVRRVPGGTVLDWSITALSGPGRAPGEPVGDGLTLGLHEEADVALVDRPAGRVYRPLTTTGSGSRDCPCTPVSLVERDLAYDVPRLLQVAYPALPADLRVVDVSIALAPAFSRVPVAPLGKVSAPITETDLAAPVEPPPPLGRTPQFRLPGGQLFAIEVDAVLAGGTLTSVVWTLESMSRGPGPPPGLAPTLTRNDAWRVAPVQVEATGPGDVGCLCSDPTRWRDQLTEPGRRVTVVTTLGEIPRGATTVDVEFGEVSPLRGIPVRPASDATLRAPAPCVRPCGPGPSGPIGPGPAGRCRPGRRRSQ